MIAINIEGEIKVFFEIPKKWNGIDRYDTLSAEKHFKDGWKTLIVPQISETQKIGDLMEVDDHVTYEVLELSQDELDALEERKANAIKAEIKSKYEFHKQNGWEFYQNFRAEIVASIHGGDITEEDAFSIEAHLKDGFDKIANTGDWKTARFILNQKTASNEVVASYKEIAMQEITTYIDDNYENY